MRHKKYLTMFLSFIFAFVSLYPINAMENIKDESNTSKDDKSKYMEFYKKSSNLIKENWNDNYFESIKLKVGKDYLTVDNSNKKIKLSSKVSVKDDTVILPVEEIVDLSGGKIHQKDEDIKINYFGNSVALEEGSDKIEVNKKVKKIEEDVEINNDNVMAPIDVLSKGLGYTYKYDKKNKEIELTSPYQTMRLIVKLKNNNSNLSKYNAKEIVKGPNNIVVLQFDSIENTKLACEEIQKDNIAIYVEPDYYISTEKTATLSPKNVSASYNSWGVKYIEAEKYASYLKKQNLNNSITVGVVDSGIDKKHSIFKNRIVNGGYDFIDSDKNPNDGNGHGTHVSGTIVDCTPNLNIKILPVRVLDDYGRGTSMSLANGVEYCVKNGVEVINISIELDTHVDYIHEIIGNAISDDVAVVISAGNNSNNTNNECPSDMYDPIVVSAINSYGNLCDFSNYGSTIDVAAPGEDVYSAYPGGGYTSLNGTSMAAPHISAVCAMYRLQNSKASIYQVEYLLWENTKDLGQSGWDEYYGYGVPHLSLAVPKKAPKKVEKVKSTQKSYNSIKLTWAKPSGAYGYQIYRSTSKNGKYTKIKNINLASTLSYTDKNLTTNQTYYYKIRAFNKTNGKKLYGDYSSVVSAKPSLSKPTLSLSSKSKKAYIKYSKVAGASGYQIYRAKSKNGTYSNIKTITSGKTTSYTDSKLTKNKIYYYKVRAYKTVNNKKVYGPYSTVKYIKIK